MGGAASAPPASLTPMPTRRREPAAHLGVGTGRLADGLCRGAATVRIPDMPARTTSSEATERYGVTDADLPARRPPSRCANIETCASQCCWSGAAPRLRMSESMAMHAQVTRSTVAPATTNRRRHRAAARPGSWTLRAVEYDSSAPLADRQRRRWVCSATRRRDNARRRRSVIEPQFVGEDRDLCLECEPRWLRENRAVLFRRRFMMGVYGDCRRFKRALRPRRPGLASTLRRGGK